MGTQKRFVPKRSLVTLASMFGEPPLIPGESREAYVELQLRIANALKPYDAVEELIARNCADHAWQIARWQRSRTVYLTAQMPGVLLSVLRPFFDDPEKKTALDFDDLESLLQAWASGEPNALEIVTALLSKLGLTVGMIADRVVTSDHSVLNVVDRIERQILIHETRLEDDLELFGRYRGRRGRSRQNEGAIDCFVDSLTGPPQTEGALSGEKNDDCKKIGE